MRLISCHVENFGKLQNFDYIFASKSIIHEENGWGKSTLATFIRVMFYGFLGEGKRKETENERKRFKPWQQGTYGGNLVFEAGGKEYRIERTFGEKKSGTDVFNLYDNATNLKSDDYSVNIGEELFGIDVESFMRTVFIAQQDCGTGVTPDISAKIGNVSDQTADMGNYDEVQNKLKKLSDSLTPDRATGSLNKMTQRIGELKEYIRNKANYEDNLRILNDNLKQVTLEKEKKNKELQRVQDEIEKVASVKDALGEIEQYKEICKQEKTALEKFTERKERFPQKIPERNELDTVLNQCDEYENHQQNINHFELTKEELEHLKEYSIVFENGTPKEEILNDTEEKIDRLADLCSERDKNSLSNSEREKLEKAEELFADYVPTLDEIDSLTGEWAERKSKKDTLSTKKANAELYKQASNHAANNTTDSTSIIFIVLGIVLIVSGIGLFAATGLLAAALIFGLIGAVLIVVAAIRPKTKSNVAKDDESDHAYGQMLEEIRADEIFVNRIEVECRELFQKLGVNYNEYDVALELNKIRNYVKDYNDLKERSDGAFDSESEKAVLDVEKEIRDFFDTYHITVEAADYQKAIFRLKGDASDYERLKERKNKYDEALRAAEALKEEMSEFIMTIGLEVDGDFRKQLMAVKEDLSAYEFLKKDYEDKKTGKEEFENSHDIAGLEEKKAALENVSSMEELNTEYKELQKNLSSITEIESRYNDQLADINRRYEEIENYESDLAVLQEDYDNAFKKYSVIMKTRTYLEKAKENFSGRYMGSIKASFDKYHNMISDSNEQYELDANLNISLREKGSLHSIESLSEGYKDLVGLCRRMAMIDAMYEKEKPFLIFDDPFVNLDEDRLNGALGFMERLTGDYQIVYFACHQSRC